MCPSKSSAMPVQLKTEAKTYGTGKPCPMPASASVKKSSQAPIRKVNPVSVDPNKPSGNIQVRHLISKI